MTSQERSPAGYTAERHPELFKERPAKGNKPGQLSRAQLDEFYTRGFTLVRDFFAKEELDALKVDIVAKVSELADKLYNASKIKDKHEGLGFYHRLCAIERDFPGANIVLIKMTPNLPPSFRAIAAHERMLNLLEDIVGPNISFNPVWNLRTKTPNNAASSTVPWHQDSGYFDVESYNALIVTAWVPLLDANEQNGTLQIVPGCHRDGYIAKHTCCAGPTWYIDLDEDTIEKEFGMDMAKDAVTLDVPYGSFLLFNNFTPHRSLNNRSDVVRWSTDFRWQRTGTGTLGLKPTCEVRRDGEPDFRPDWDSFDSVDRNRAQLESMARDDSAADEFNILMSGPWMKKWEIVNHNKHTDEFEKNSEDWKLEMLHG